MQKVLTEDSKTESGTSPIDPGTRESEEKRTAFASLKGHGKKQTVGSVRVGHAKKSENPGTIHSQNSNSNQKFSVYQEETPDAGANLPLESECENNENLPF